MKLKRPIIAMALCCLFIIVSAYAAPNTVSVYGKIYNNATKNIAAPGWNYIKTRIYLTNPKSDAHYAQVNGTDLPSNGLYLDLYPDASLDYLFDTTHLTGKLIIHAFDPNCNTVCEWEYFQGQIAPKLTVGGDYCIHSYNDLYVNQACTLPT